MREADLGQAKRRRGLVAFLRSWLGNSAHLSMWDYPSLENELTTAGFTSIRKAVLGDNPDEMFARVEHPVRWVRGTLGMECVKPFTPEAKN